MSYSYRKINLECADWLLETLNREVTIEKDSASGKFKRTIYKRKTFDQLLDISKASAAFTIDDIERATRLLHRNGHIWYRYEHNDYMQSEVECNVEGEDAYNESFYLEAIRHDFDETMTLRVRWLLPYLTILFSMAALIISILSYIHGRK